MGCNPQKYHSDWHIQKAYDIHGLYDMFGLHPTDGINGI